MITIPTRQRLSSCILQKNKLEATVGSILIPFNMSTLLNEILQENESSSCSSTCNCKHCADARNKKILQGNKSSSYHSTGCNCSRCLAARSQKSYSQNEYETEFEFRILVPVSELSSEFELETLTEQVRACLENFHKNNFPVSVLSSQKANEIVLEDRSPAEVIRTNQKSGNRFKNRIGNYIKECLGDATVMIEGTRLPGGKKLSIGEKVNIGGKKKTMRFIDIRVVKGKDIVNIETKRGKSSYKKQKPRDAYLERTGRGPTLVVRNCGNKSKHPDCGDQESNETLLGEILNEFEVPVRPTLRYGATGVNVVYLQKRLNYHNSSIIPLKEDGIWGPKTRTAVLTFQRSKGLLVDGIVGPKTWGALDADITSTIPGTNPSGVILAGYTPTPAPCEPWSDLLNFRVPGNITMELQNRTPNYFLNKGWPIQYIENGTGDINLDFYGVFVSRLPVINNRRVTAETLLNYIRKNINDFIDTNLSKFEPYSEPDRIRWLSNSPTGAVIHIDIPHDDGSVINSYYDPTNWIFSTISTPDDGTHPVCGHRQFGFKISDQNNLMFFTRGADRVYANLPNPNAWIFNGGHNLWLSYQRRLTDFINNNGGQARISITVSKRHFWPKVKAQCIASGVFI